MPKLELTPAQKSIILAPVGNPRAVFLHGPAGCGKTTAAVERLRYLLDIGVRGDSLLVWVPQRSLGRPYSTALRGPDVPAGPTVDVVSLDGLARRTLELFWPLVAADAGFDPLRSPTFLTLETTQYYLDQVVEPLYQEGAFGDVTLPRNRLMSQIIDNLNKAALVGFAHTEIASRLSSAWTGPSSRERVYEAVQRAATGFRDYCLAHNLLDFALQVETFMRFVWSRPECQAFLLRGYRHVIADNLEEDIPVAHDLLRAWVKQADSALLVMDEEAGFRSYLGADPRGAAALRDLCDREVLLDLQQVASAQVMALGAGLAYSSRSPLRQGQTAAPDMADMRSALAVDQWHFHTDMLVFVADEVEKLVHSAGIAPGEIAIVSPFVDDALRFALVTELQRRKVPVRTHRPSRSLREEPAVLCLLTLAQLAHPHWEQRPPASQVALALTRAINDLDLSRATTLVRMLYRSKDSQPQLREFGMMRSEAQQRITYVLGERYTGLRQRLMDYQQGQPPPLDVFLSRLFDELLCRPGYGFHNDLDAAAATASLIESVRKFRWAVETSDNDELGKRYLAMVGRGVLAAQYLRSGADPDEAVFVGPAHTFLTENRPVSYQFWLFANSPAWGRRLYQPLTHPFVLTRHWPRGTQWTDEDEFQTGEETLSRLILGLTRRCREQVYLTFCDLNPRGREERGPLADRMQNLLRQARRQPERKGADGFGTGDAEHAIPGDSLV